MKQQAVVLAIAKAKDISGISLAIADQFTLYFCLYAAKHAEIWRLATSMDDYKSEIENWDLGAGIYISFYLIRSSLQEDDNSMSGLVGSLIFIERSANISFSLPSNFHQHTWNHLGNNWFAGWLVGLFI